MEAISSGRKFKPSRNEGKNQEARKTEKGGDKAKMSIISFEEKMKKEQELEEKEFQQSLQNSFDRTIESFRENGMEDNFDALFDSMFSRLQKIVENP